MLRVMFSAAVVSLILGIAVCRSVGDPVALDTAGDAGVSFLQIQMQIESARSVAAGIQPMAVAYSVARAQTLQGPDGKALAHVLDLAPTGHIVLSTDTEVAPVIAYSFDGPFPWQDDPQNVLLHMVQWDMANRLKALPVTANPIKEANQTLWQQYLDALSGQSAAGGDGRIGTSAILPPPVGPLADTEQWGHWVQTTWHQHAPFNNFCPLDPNTNPRQRCITGCTATAMGQIVNYWRYPVSVTFASTADDYTSTYNGDDGNGVRTINLDSDSVALDFPAYTTSPWHLAYDGTDADVARICFASGLAHQMRYTSAKSGRPADPSAFTDKFQYASAEKITTTACAEPTGYYKDLERNMKNEQPALLSIFEGCAVCNTCTDRQNSTGKSHSIVCDGYRSTGLYHLNFGWGGNPDEWYSLPAGMPSGYTIVARQLVNIHPYVWPMFHQNPKHTGRSPHKGSAANNLRWRFAAGDDVDSSPAVGNDGTVYVGSLDGKLYAIASDGSMKWQFTTGGEVFSSPAIGPAGTIYVGSKDKKLYAVNPNGTQKWAFTTGGAIYSSPTVGRDGIIYVGSTDSTLYAVNTNGTQKWAASLTGTIEWSSPALATNGTVYIGAGLKLFARNSDGTAKWSYTLGIDEIYSSPAVANDGTIYIGYFDGKLFAIKADGTLKWTYATGAMIRSSPAIGIDGTIYVGSNDDRLYAIKPDGTLKWSFVTGGDVQSSPAIGFDGTQEIIYVGSNDKKVYAIKPDGTKKWEVNLPASTISSPAIAKDGTVYVGCTDNRLYAIGGDNHAPSLAWTGESGYTADGVEPDRSNSGTQTFTFRLTYTDSDNHFPKTGYPKLLLSKALTPVAGSPFTMTEADGGDIDCVDGKLYTCTVSSLADGNNYSYYFVALDAQDAGGGGPPNSGATGPVVDTTPPDTQITSGPSGFIDTGVGNVAFSWSGSDAITAAGNLVYSHKFDDTGWSDWSGATALTVTYGDGPRTFSVEAKDELGNVDPTPATQAFTVDGTPPANPTGCTEGGSAPYYTWQNAVSDPSFTWSGASDGAYGSGVSGYYWCFGTDSDGWPETETTAAACDPSSVSDGKYYLRVRTKDILGHVSGPATLFIFCYDGTAPGAPSIDSAVGHGWQGNNCPLFSWSCSDTGGSGLSKYWYKLNNDAWTSTADSPKQYNYLLDGTNAFHVKAEDLAGNVGPESTYSFKIDTAPPVAYLRVATLGEIRKSAAVSFDGSGSSDANGIEQYDWDFGDGTVYTETASSAPDGAFDGWTTHAFSTAGTFTVSFTVHDPAGNTGRDTAWITVTSKPVATIVSIVPNPAIAGEKVSFTGSCYDPDNDSIVATNWRSSVDGQLSTALSFSTQALTPSDVAPHTIFFKVKDSDGFWSDEAVMPLWVYVPKPWPMFKNDAARNGYRSFYPGIPGVPHGMLDYAVAWSKATDGPISGSPVAANVDGDWVNGLEIAVATTAGTLYLLDNAGNVLWSRPVGASYSTPAIADINGDGHLDIVIGSTTGVRAFDRNGTNLFTLAVAAAQPAGKEFGSSPVVADIDDNPFTGMETVMGFADGTVRAISAGGGTKWSYSPGVVKFVSSPAVADVDSGSGYEGLETVIGSTGGRLYVIGSTGSVITSWSPGATSIDTTPAIADLVPATNGLEIVFGTDGGRCYCLNYKAATHSLVKLWQYPAVGDPALAAIDSSPAVHGVSEYGPDVNNVVFGCDNGKVYVVRAEDGGFVVSYQSNPAVEVNSTPTIGDIDTRYVNHGWNLPDVAFGTAGGNLHGVSFNGLTDLVPPTPWSPAALSPGFPINGSPALADLNHDGQLEILIGSRDGKLYVLKTSAPGNQPPVGGVLPNYLGLTGQSLTLDASSSYDPNESSGDSVTRYRWYINPWSSPVYETSSPVATLTWAALEARGIYGAGNYSVACIVLDSYGEYSEPVYSTIAIHNSVALPTANPGGPYDIMMGNTVTLDGTGSRAEEGENAVVTYAWDLDNDGQYDDESRPQVTLSWEEMDSLGIATTGSHTVLLKVTDRLGQESAAMSTTLEITENQPPEVSTDGPWEIEIGESVTLTASGSDPDEPDDYVTEYWWDLDGDGGFGEYTGLTVTVSWSFLSTGCVHRGQSAVNPVRVRVRDTRGGQGTSEAASLFICTNGPVAVAEANGSTAGITARIGQSITFTHGASYHGWSSHRAIAQYEWDFDGNGTTDWSTGSAAASNAYAYATTGVYRATLTVTDDNAPAKSATDVVEVAVGNLPPVADPSGPYTVAFSDGVVLNGSASRDPDGSLARYEWDLDYDGAFDDGEGAQAALTWANLGLFGITNTGASYPIRLRVLDNEGSAGAATTEVAVVKESVTVGWPVPHAVYSDEEILALPATDNDGDALKRQAAHPKTLLLEVFREGGWAVLSEDALYSPDDTDQELDFVFRVRQGETDLEPGTHPLRVRFGGDPDYAASVREGMLTLVREEVAISEPQAQVVYGGSAVVEVTVRDDDGDYLYHQVPEGHVMAMEAFDGASWLLIGEDALESAGNDDDLLEYPVAVGHAALDLPQGVHPLRVRFDGDAYYAEATGAGSLTVSAAPVQFLDNVDLPAGDWIWDGVYTEPIELRCRLVEEGGSNLVRQAAEPKTVYLEYRRGEEWVAAGTNSLSAPDDSDSTVEFASQLIEGMLDAAPGVNDVQFRFEGDSRYAPCTREATLAVERQATHFVDPEGDWIWSFGERDEKAMHVQLLDSGGEYLRHLDDEPKLVYADYLAGTQWVEFGSTAITEPMPSGSASTYEDAWLRFLWPEAPGTYPIRFRFDGDTCYEPAERTASMTIVSGTRGWIIMVR